MVCSCKQEVPAPEPIANFYVDNAECLSSCYVKFYDQSYHAVKWKWEFGNSLTSEKQNDSCQYHDPGFYDVTLHVWNEDDVEDKITKQITVY
ncbi:MAG: PKD domain-containing protein [Crocinitomicaceae bacterium]|nr:hypothetical protein [Crocinitomicaceae bacterium]